MSNDQSQREIDDELLSAYLDGELSTEEHARVEERLRSDPAARRLVEELRAVSGAVQGLPRETYAGDMQQRVWGAIDGADSSVAGRIEPARHDHWAGIRRGLAWSAVAIAATLVLMVVQPEGEQGADRELARVDEPREGEEKAKQEEAASMMAAEAPRERSRPPEMRAAAPAEGEPTPAPSADTMAEVAGELAEAPAAIEPPQAPSGGAATVSRGPARPVVAATIDATARRAGSLEQLERLLAEHEIQLSAEDGTLTSTGSVEAKRSSPAARLAPGDEALVVEASAAQVAAVYRALRADRERFANVRVVAATAGRDDARQRGLRELLADEAAEESLGAETFATKSADEAPRPAAAPMAASPARDAGARSAPSRDADATAPSQSVRVMFILRAAE
jgi:hypothetical protein